MLPQLGPMELIIILVIALMIFGAGKLPEVGSALGKGIKEFKRSTGDDPPREIAPSTAPPVPTASTVPSAAPVGVPAAGSLYCPKCGVQATGDGRFCAKCGASLPSAVA